MIISKIKSYIETQERKKNTFGTWGYSMVHKYIRNSYEYTIGPPASGLRSLISRNAWIEFKTHYIFCILKNVSIKKYQKNTSKQENWKICRFFLVFFQWRQEVTADIWLLILLLFLIRFEKNREQAYILSIYFGTKSDDKICCVNF